MSNDFKDRYIRHVQSVVRDNTYDLAMELAVGGSAEVMGTLELALLRHYGLKDDTYLIDVGCGSGRLTLPLSRSHEGRYLGTDLVPELLQYNRNRTERSDWRFEEVNGLRIPEADEEADMICFFSVFTHLLHEQSFLYLQEACRVLRPGGVLVFSFLDFSVGVHWQIFLATVERERIGTTAEAVLNVFIDPPSIRRWAEALGLDVIEIRSGVDRYIPISTPITLEDGRTWENFAALGHSICALRKPPKPGREPYLPIPLLTEPPVELPSETDKLGSQLAIRNQEIEALRVEVAGLRSSMSWRLTRPLRILRAWLGTGRKKQGPKPSSLDRGR